ncbi:MAG: hypothetical protein SGJ27_13305 [Candidatus Melainabacteria bacterium]|nr:hypothetical protein [Candidatus Melainabacteria bacterium]
MWLKTLPTRRAPGACCLEITITAFLMCVFSVVGLDTTLIILGMSLNDAACRDAARAAAKQSSADKAIQAAQSQLRVHCADGYWITQPVLESCSAPNFVFNDFGNHPPPNTSPYVTVTTTITIKCPAPIVFFGADFVKDGAITYSRRYTYPIIKVKFYG